MQTTKVRAASAVLALGAVTAVLFVALRNPHAHPVSTTASSSPSSSVVLAQPPTSSTVAGTSPTAIVPSSVAPTGVVPSTTVATPTAPARTYPPPVVSAPPSSPPAPPAPVQLPIAGDVADARQVITVVANDWGNTRGRLQAWEPVDGGWRQIGPTVSVWLGAAGFRSPVFEGSKGTPVGTFPITQAFGNYANPGTALPYFRSDTNDWWVSDTTSPAYNTHQRCAAAQCPFDISKGENLGAVGWVYGYSIVIDYNTNPVQPGAGSAFFLHITTGTPTAGCVAMSTGDIARLLKWLTPAAHPRLVMGVI